MIVTALTVSKGKLALLETVTAQSVRGQLRPPDEWLTGLDDCEREGCQGGHVLADLAKRWSGGPADLIAVIGEGDAWMPEHLLLLAESMAIHPEAGFCYTIAREHRSLGEERKIGTDPPSRDGIAASALVYRAGLALIMDWGPWASFSTWDLVSQWMTAGVQWVHTPDLTVDTWAPCLYR